MFVYRPRLEDSVFDQFRRLSEEMDELFGDWGAASGIRSLPRGTFPAVNVGASPEKLEVYVFAPGVDPKKVDISLQENLLTISGERTVERPENANFYRRERFSGAFRRVITLPEDVDVDHVDARYRDGVLQVSVPRREPARPRQIQIQ
jgi:HSP20 family protein